MLSLTTLLEFNFRCPTIVPGEVLALTLLMAFAILSTLEVHAPRDNLPTKHLRRSYKTNISLLLVNSIAMSLVSVSSLLILAERYSDKGLLNSLSSPGWKAALSFLSIDLLMYLWHKPATTLIACGCFTRCITTILIWTFQHHLEYIFWSFLSLTP